CLRLTPEESDIWEKAKAMVWKHRNPEQAKIVKWQNHITCYEAANRWFMSKAATAIDRIIAALIAKQKEKPNADKD
ncbi:unnamed protein product, partial [marine sediment metagenome]